MSKLWCVVVLGAAACSCGGNRAKEFAKLREEFVFKSLSFSPVSATAAGLHEYAGQRFDEMLDDTSAAALDGQRQFYRKVRDRLAAIPRERLGAEDRADYSIIQDQISLNLLELDELQSVLHNPTLYVESLGNALFSQFVLEYAPQPQRMRHIIARLRKVPLFLDQARTNLVSSPALWTKVAAEENEGNIRLVDKTIRAAVPADLRDEFDRAARPALDAMAAFQTYLTGSLANRNTYDWRLGGNRYTRKFRYTLAAGVEADTVLQMAESDLERVRARMYELALPLHGATAAGARGREDSRSGETINRIVGEVLERISKRHATRDSYMDEARADLDEARRFVAARRLLTLPPRANLQVIETPEFMRGIYAVGGFNPAPPLEPHLGAFYWVTPIPAAWPAARVESKLREYNFYKLKLLTIHEAMPGHYVQFEFANDIQPRDRRILRAIYGNGPYIEGWAQYATQIMLDEGYLDHSRELALTFAKEELRVIANAILDIRLHMLNMSDQEALDLMQKQTFQEAEEATAKLQRAKLSSCQLPTYFVGWRGWLRVREQYQQARGASYRLSEFNDEALRKGAVPLPQLGELLAARTAAAR